MSKTTYFCCAVCLLAGLAIGYIASKVRYAGILASSLESIQISRMAVSEDRAFQAYQHESASIAIYALTGSLNELTNAEQDGEVTVANKRILELDEMLTHARLAKLYFQIGQTNLGNQHVSEALDCAGIAGSRDITNETTLMGMIDGIDKAAK